MRLISYLALFSGILIAGVAMTRMAGGYSGLLSPFAIWVAAPYLITLALMASAKVRTIHPFTFCYLLMVVSAGSFLYIDSAFIHLDAQGGLIFVFAPLYQIMAIIVYGMASYLLAKVLHSKVPPQT